MADGLSRRLVKALLVLFVCLYWVSGGALLLLGSALLVDSSRQLLFFLVHIEGDLMLPTFRLLCVGLVLVGTLKLLVGILGCGGVLRENTCINGFYFCFVLITLCSELSVGIFSCIHEQKTNEALEATLGRKLAKYYGVPGFESETVAIDFAQYKVNNWRQ